MAKKKTKTTKKKPATKRSPKATVDQRIDVILASLLNLEKVVRDLQYEIKQLKEKQSLPTMPTHPYPTNPKPWKFPPLDPPKWVPTYNDPNVVPVTPTQADNSNTGNDPYKARKFICKPCDVADKSIVCCKDQSQ